MNIFLISLCFEIVFTSHNSCFMLTHSFYSLFFSPYERNTSAHKVCKCFLLHMVMLVLVVASMQCLTECLNTVYWIEYVVWPHFSHTYTLVSVRLCVCLRSSNCQLNGNVIVNGVYTLALVQDLTVMISYCYRGSRAKHCCCTHIAT